MRQPRDFMPGLAPRLLTGWTRLAALLMPGQFGQLTIP
jgi:hypothetical protein